MRVVNKLINAALSEAHPKRAEDSAVLVTLFATRSVGAEATADERLARS